MTNCATLAECGSQVSRPSNVSPAAVDVNASWTARGMFCGRGREHTGQFPCDESFPELGDGPDEVVGDWVIEERYRLR